jgi:hypothetical protein
MYHTILMLGEGVIIKNLLSATDEKWHDHDWRLINSTSSLTQIIRYEPWIDSTIALFLERCTVGLSVKRGPKDVVNFYAMAWVLLRRCHFGDDL